ncbi:MAG: UDP-N-acetylglucosamine--N-acetylmuramyl-(pentapeptide) pyrophosphoryl-undecaprenol N-acetylglucosamine transferase [Fuerstiella sp.]|nr:UDP-N-acetylglucosamine--N-acetylmuramyl-(pentapeptide) pyrophosphoryl-undecaprenol N-acetylglucosamine transferase [Fuerstiella sp.]
MSQSQLIAFCGGGSGGHLVPALAIAEQLLGSNPSMRFLFLTSDRPIDHHIIATCGLPAESFEHIVLPVRSSAARVSFAIRSFRSALKCRRCFRQLKPSVVVGLGGFASMAGVIAARLSGLPIVLLEQNTIPGRANRWLRRIATRTFTGWPLEPSWGDKWRTPLTEVGVPLRRSFQSDRISSTSGVTTATAPVRLVVLGGSLGAKRLNSIVLDALIKSGFRSEELQIVHQAGHGDVDRVRQAYDRAEISAEVVAFADDMHGLLSSASLVISRCGAVALAEIAACGKASILFPLSVSADDHQFHNAEHFGARGAAVVVHESEEDAATRLSQHLADLLSPDDSVAASNVAPPTSASVGHRLVVMADSARELAPGNAAAVIATSLLQFTDIHTFSSVRMK